MAEELTINKATTIFEVTGRALRYWEDAGLFKSKRDAQSGWRVYDDAAVLRIRLTVLLRQLDIPVQDIKQILKMESAEEVCAILEKQLSKLNYTDFGLQAQKTALSTLLHALKANSMITLSSFEQILSPIVATDPKISDFSKEKENHAMDPINAIIGEIRIVTLPPMRTAANSQIGVEPEDAAMQPVLEWLRAENLTGTARVFGFNVEPYPTADKPEYGFAYCASIPNAATIPEHLYELYLPGGIYAELDVPVTTDPSYTWRQYQELFQADQWEWVYDTARNPGLEEHVARGDESGYRITVLTPIKRRN